jgi:hypothetical protein
LIIVHGSALSVIAFLTVPWWTKLFLALGVIGQWWVSWRRHIALSSPTAVKGLLWKADDDWELSAVDGTMRKARLLPGAYVHPRLVVLAFVMEDKRKRAVVLPSDSLDPDCHRRLRVWLRLLQERSDARGRPQL